MSTQRRAARAANTRPRRDSSRQSGAAEIGAPLTVGEAAALLRLTSRRVQALAREGRIPGRRIGRRWLFRRAELEQMVGATPGAPPREPALSARNRLRGQIRSLRTDGLMAEVVVAIGDQELVAIITRSSAEALKLRRGDGVEAVVKSTEVMIAKDLG
jgi:molybdopterin-binding protein